MTVWQAISAGLSALRRVIEGEALARFSTAIDGLCGPITTRLGPEGAADEDDRTREYGRPYCACAVRSPIYPMPSTKLAACSRAQTPPWQRLPSP